MKNYILSTVDLIISLSVLTILGVRDGEIIPTTISAIISLCIYGYVIYNLTNKKNPTKVETVIKIFSFASLILLGGGLYEAYSGQRIEGDAENLLTILVALICLFIWVYNYYLKPYLHFKRKNQSDK